MCINNSTNKNLNKLGEKRKGNFLPPKIHSAIDEFLLMWKSLNTKQYALISMFLPPYPPSTD